ncbi:MAG: preprotein translocase subunit SecG [Holosporaceae bacterium]|jgi:preprotein translocase subunit SecG|nr:preprotein translocase subunit SecG [Holosporaceae bacterium]
MVQSFLLAVHFILTILIIGLIMLQKHDSDGALGSSGGGAGSGMFSVRGQANLLTHGTAILMAVFILNCLVLAKMFKNQQSPGSLIDRVASEAGVVEPPVAPESTAAPKTTDKKEPGNASKNDNAVAPQPQPQPAVVDKTAKNVVKNKAGKPKKR